MQAQITTSQVISEACILMFPRQQWQDLVYYLKKNFEKGNDEILKGTLHTIKSISNACLVEGMVELKEIIDELFHNVFYIVKKGKILEAIDTLQTRMLCHPTCIDNTQSRQILMRNLAKNLNSMEENFKEQALRLIMFRLVAIDRADPMHNPSIVAEMEQLLDALNRKVSALFCVLCFRLL